jgi:hypothetical protein
MEIRVENIQESTEYENCIGVTVELDKPANLMTFLGMEDEDEPDQEWKKHWVNMPDFDQEDNPPYKKLIISFRTAEDYAEFSKLIGQRLTDKTKSIWHPELDRDANTLKRWIED